MASVDCKISDFSAKSVSQFVLHLQNQVNFDYIQVSLKFAEILKSETLLVGDFDSESACNTAASLLWVYRTVLASLDAHHALNNVVESSLPFLLKIVTRSISLLDSNIKQSLCPYDETCLKLLLGISTGVQCCQVLVLYLVNTAEDNNSVGAFPASLPGIFVELLHSVLLHCKDCGPLYEAAGVTKSCSAALSLSHSAADVAVAVFESIPALSQGVITAPYTAGKLISSICLLSRLLSVLAAMRAVVCGWRCATALVQRLQEAHEAEAVVRAGGLDLLRLIVGLEHDLQEGLDLLFSMQELQGKDNPDCLVVLRRVVKMCGLCVKLLLVLLDVFVEHCDAAVVRATLDCCLTLSRCCVTVSLLQVTDIAPLTSDGRIVIGRGLAEQLRLSVQLLVAGIVRHRDFSEVFAGAVCEWITEISQMEDEYLQQSVSQDSGLDGGGNPNLDRNGILAVASTTNTSLSVASDTNTSLSVASDTNTSLSVATATNTSLSVASTTNTSLSVANATNTSLSVASDTTSLSVATATNTSLSVASTTNTSLSVANATNTSLSVASTTTANAAESSTRNPECWSGVSGGLYLMVVSTCLVLPDVLAQASTGKGDEDHPRQLPVTLLASLITCLPRCQALLCSQLAIDAPVRDGQAPVAMPLYEVAVVAASIAVSAVEGDLWMEAEAWLCGAVLARPDVILTLQSEKLEHTSEKARVSNDNKDSLRLASSGVSTHDDPSRGGCSSGLVTMATLLMNRGADWWWPHLLASDVLVLVNRLGSAELCCAQYQALSKAVLHLPVSPSMLPYLALLLSRLQALLQCLPDTLPSSNDPECAENMQLVKSCLSGVCLYRGKQQRSYSTGYVEQCKQHSAEVCSSVVQALTALLSPDQCTKQEHQAQLLHLHHRLTSLHLLLMFRQPGTHAAVTTYNIDNLTGIVQPLVELWRRVPAPDTGNSAGDWLLAVLASVTGDVADLLDNMQLITVLRVCRGVVRGDETGCGGEAVCSVVTGLARCSLLHPAQLQSSVCQLLTEVCACLVREDRHSWVLQCALHCFLHFAQHTPHKQIITSVLQCCPASVKSRLQKFLLQEPHPTPSNTGAPGTSATSSSTCHPRPDALPLFLFHQQCIVNSRGKIKQGCDNFVPVLSPQVELAVSYEDARRVGSEQAKNTNKRERDGSLCDDLCNKISLNMKQSCEYWTDITDTDLSGCEARLQSVFQCTQELLCGLRQVHAARDSKRAKLTSLADKCL